MPSFKYEGFTEVVMKSQKSPLNGQKNRSSGNYLFTLFKFEIDHQYFYNSYNR